MKVLKIILAFLIITVGFSCEYQPALTDISLTNCNECPIDEPLNATVKIKTEDPFRFGEANPVVLIDVYEGPLEDGILFLSIQTSAKETNINLPIDKTYSFTATYLIDGNTYIAVNSATTRVRFTESMCDEPCYYTVPRSVNLVLKYTK